MNARAAGGRARPGAAGECDNRRMCLITVAYRASARFPVVVAANRDERHARAAAPAGWWPDAPRVLGGRDLVAGGSWLAIDRDGRIGAVTNRAPAEQRAAPASRGALVAEYLSAGVSAHEFAARASARGARFGPFNLVLVDGDAVHVVSNRAESLRLTHGIRSFGNTGLTDTSWPKLATATAGVEQALDAGDPVAALLNVLATRRAGSPVSGPDRDNPFVVGPEFGTRCSTVILVDAAGRATFVERRFDAAADTVGEDRFEFETRCGALSAAP